MTLVEDIALQTMPAMEVTEEGAQIIASWTRELRGLEEQNLEAMSRIEASWRSQNRRSV